MITMNYVVGFKNEFLCKPWLEVFFKDSLATLRFTFHSVLNKYRSRHFSFAVGKGTMWLHAHTSYTLQEKSPGRGISSVWLRKI